MATQTPYIDIPFANGYYRSGRSLPFSAQRCINWYPNFSKRPALSEANLYMIPGVYQVISSTDGANRGSCLFDGKPYFVNGSKLYRVDQTIAPDLTETYAAVEIGVIGGTGRVIMVAGQFDLVVVVPDQVSFSYNGVTLTALNGLPNFRTARDVVHINSLFVFLESNSNIIFHSELNDPTTYGALNFTPVFQIEEGVGLVKFRNQLYVMGSKQTIPFVYTGGVISGTINVFAFDPQPNAEIDIGLRSVFTKSNIRQSVMFLGGSENEEPGVWLFPSFQKISDETIDNVIQNLSDSEIDSAFFEKHTQNNSECVAIVAGDNCFVYDVRNNAWHERRSRVDETDLRWRVNSIVQAYNRLFVGDYIDGRIGILDDQITTEYDKPVHREVILQPLNAKGAYVKASSMLIAMDAGFDGEITMSFSTDGGYTFNNGRTVSAGAQGEYGRRVEITQLGSAPFSRVYKLNTSTTAKCNINKVLVR